jgi:hypothetical protein
MSTKKITKGLKAFFVDILAAVAWIAVRGPQ